MDVTTTYLEMTSPLQLNRVRSAPPALVVMEETFAEDSADLLRIMHLRVCRPHGRRVGYTEQQWAEWFAKPHRFWIPKVEDESIGILVLDVDDDAAEVEIRVIGLVPEFIGKGYGGHTMGLATQLAWNLKLTKGRRVRRVWLHTDSRDHQHAMNNYLRRGFTVYKTEHEKREIPNAL